MTDTTRGETSLGGAAAWDAVRRHHRPHAHWYATHVLGWRAGPACDALVDAAFDRALRRLGAQKRRPRPVPDLTTVRDELQLAIRHEAWRAQRRPRRWARRHAPTPAPMVRPTLATAPRHG